MTHSDIAPFGIMEDEKTFLFIDGPSFYSLCKSVSIEVDYQKILDIFRQGSRFVRAIYYTPISEDEEFIPVRPLIDWLDYNGYSVKSKPVKTWTDSEGRPHNRGKITTDLAIDLLEAAIDGHADHIVLFSGDGDLGRAVEAAQRRGARVTVVATTNGTASAADNLRRQADAFVNLTDVSKFILKQPRARAVI